MDPLARTALHHPTLPHSPACSLLLHSFIHQRTAGQGIASQASCASGPPKPSRTGGAGKHTYMNVWSADTAAMEYTPMPWSPGHRWSHAELEPGFTAHAAQTPLCIDTHAAFGPSQVLGWLWVGMGVSCMNPGHNALPLIWNAGHNNGMI